MKKYNIFVLGLISVTFIACTHVEQPTMKSKKRDIKYASFTMSKKPAVVKTEESFWKVEKMDVEKYEQDQRTTSDFDKYMQNRERKYR